VNISVYIHSRVMKGTNVRCGWCTPDQQIC